MTRPEQASSSPPPPNPAPIPDICGESPNHQLLDTGNAFLPYFFISKFSLPGKGGKWESMETLPLPGVENHRCLLTRIRICVSASREQSMEPSCRYSPCWKSILGTSSLEGRLFCGCFLDFLPAFPTLQRNLGHETNSSPIIKVLGLTMGATI